MRRSAQTGFTLLEMLAALTVMAVCSSVLLVAFGQSARSLQQVSRSDRLSHAARTVFDQEAAGPLQSGTRNGVLDGDINWQLEISQQPGKAGQARVYRLDLTVSEDRRKATFSTLKLRGPTDKAGA
ncbi:general secretion pathway protein GspI [Pseudomonas syringae]|uniref:General secretion pathway protein GspI n=1 Tax=Pseudomonas syringae TaxID=317 RepID=A0A1C7Z2E2_PSESX|nr:prepilin-type N-terminal cleavage/methylation domain-containing protein [Pseudomonas syringae]OCR23953.1 general secretion pathway protein GspI [Pseudomonas syringae]